MICCLDSNLVIYFVENNPVWSPKVSARVAAIRAEGDEIAVSDAARLECLVGPLSSGDAGIVADFEQFFADPAIRMLPVTAAVWQRAARIRARHNFTPMDSVHLAAAVEHGCGRFLTNDGQLSRSSDIPVEVLS